MDKTLLKNTIAQVIHLTPARQAEICYTARIEDHSDSVVSVTLTPSLAHLTGTRIGNRNIDDLYSSMVLHTGLALGNLSELLDQIGLSYSVDRYFPTETSVGNIKARALLESNIEFIVEETAAWIEHQRTTHQGVFQDYQYDSSKCRRDLKFVLSALSRDLTHMTNRYIRSILKEYFDRKGNALIRQHVEVAAYQFVRELVGHVMSMRRTPHSYQSEIQQNLLMDAVEPDTIEWIDNLINDMITVLAWGINRLPPEISSESQQNYIKVLINV